MVVENGREAVDQGLASYEASGTARVEGRSAQTHLPRFRRGLLWLVMVVAVVAGVGGGWYWFSPERLLDRATATILSADRLEYDATVLVSASTDELPLPAVTSSSGRSISALLGITPAQAQASALSDPSLSGDRYTITLHGQVDTNGDSETNTLDVAFSSAQSPEQSGKIAMMLIGEMFYLNFVELPDFGGLDLSVVENRWISVDLQEAAREGGYDEAYTEWRKSIQAAKDQSEEILALIKASNFLNIEQNRGVSLAGLLLMAEYQVELDKAGIKEFFTAYEALTAVDQSAATNLVALDQSIDDANRLGDYNVRINAVRSLPSAFTVAVNDPASQITAQTEITFRSINDDLAIEPPSQSTPYKQFMEEISSTLSAGL